MDGLAGDYPLTPHAATMAKAYGGEGSGEYGGHDRLDIFSPKVRGAP